MGRLVCRTFVALLVGMAFVAGPVASANATPSETTFVAQGQSQGQSQDDRENESGDDDQGYWGLLGLIGLVGLVGLVRRGRRGEYLAGPAEAPSTTRYGDK
jgi:MYXO-CTERM domain-containing protein